MKPFKKPEVRVYIETARKKHDQIIDSVNLDSVLHAGFATDQGMNAIEVNGMVHPNFYKRVYYREATERLAERIDASVILTGGLRNLADMNEIAGESNVRFFGMSRPFIRHPDYLLKLKEEESRT